jgi:hypothetical protein
MLLQLSENISRRREVFHAEAEARCGDDTCRHDIDGGCEFP